MKKIRVLQVVTIMNLGGLETLIMNFYRNINRDKFDFDFLVQRNGEGKYDQEIKLMGGKIYKLPPFNPFHHKKYLKEIDVFFKNHARDYDIIHAHNNAQGMYVLRAAKKYGIKVRISHSHCSKYSIDFKIPFFVYAKLKLHKYFTNKFACGVEASKWLFNSYDSTIIPNAIDLSKFEFNIEYRKKIRNEYSIMDETIVIGHVGRFNKSKNHIFMIKVLKALITMNYNIKLLLVGSGDTEEFKIKQIVRKNKLENYVIFAGSQNKVYEYYNAMDVFIFPSIHEGLPVTLVEAQANGISCLVSDSIPKECKITSLIEFKSLKDDISSWASTLLEKSKLKRKNELVKIKNAGLEIKSATRKLEKLYEVECQKET